VTDTVRLRGLIADSGLKKGAIAEQLGITTYGLQKKIENLNEFKPTEIVILCKILNISSLEEKDKIFFTKEVDYKST